MINLTFDTTKQMENYFFIPKWPLLYEDNHLLALYKPAGLLVQGDKTGDITLLELGKSWLKKRYNKPGQVFLGMVHRLDRPVAGVVLFCRTSKAASRVSEQFRCNLPVKQYLAVVEGNITENSGTICNHISRNGTTSQISEKPSANSQKAELDFKVLDRKDGKTFVEIKLKTGRHHQIRAQLSHKGFPIIGDLRYGAKKPLPQRQIALFAQKLVINHPVKDEPLTITCPLPSGWPWIQPTTAQTPPWNWQEINLAIKQHP